MSPINFGIPKSGKQPVFEKSQEEELVKYRPNSIRLYLIRAEKIKNKRVMVDF